MACIAKRRGRYVIDFYDNHGKRRWKTLPKGTTEKKAREAMRDIEDQVKKGIYLPDRKIPTFKEVAQDWLEYKASNIRKSTWDMYRGHLEHHFEDVNGIKINRITTAKVEKFITVKLDASMNITTLRKLIVTFNQVMKYAVRHQYTDHNPVRDAERPKGQGKVDENDSEITILIHPQIKSLFGAVSNPKYKTLFMLAALGGMREGEILGSKWSDIDWDNNQIYVQRSYNKRTWYLPKTKTSKRRVDLGPKMMASLRKWRLACPPNELDLIFPSEAGKPLAESTMVRKFFKPALRKADLPDIRFHDLRHTYASLLIEQGENIKYIQTQLGHSSPVVTLEIYAHLMKPTNQESAIKLENSIFSTTGSRNKKRSYNKRRNPLK